jgi:protein-tyrosine-phosphatase
MAEYIARRRFKGHTELMSAGVQPGSIGDVSNAVYTLKQFGIDASAHIPRDVREVNLSDFDLIITMDRQVARDLKLLFPDLANSRVAKWRISDPYGDDLAEYRRCAEIIYRQLKSLLNPTSKCVQGQRK